MNYRPTQGALFGNYFNQLQKAQQPQITDLWPKQEPNKIEEDDQSTQPPGSPQQKNQIANTAIPQAPFQDLQPKKNEFNSFQSDVCQSHFLAYVLGPPASGKTTLIEEFLHTQGLYQDYFEKVLYISPHNFSKDQQLGVNWIQKIDMQFLYQYICDINDSKVQNKNYLLLFDDVIAQMKPLQKDSLFCSFFLNRRHILKNGNTLSIIITSQKYNLLPLVYRVQITMAIFFYVCQKEWQEIRQEIVKSNELEQIYKIIVKECSQKHGFVILHNDIPMKLFNSKLQRIHLYN